ncbi:MAG: histidine triad nucleotide-binding protein [Rickettsiales bacterium]|nr:histidine triad nucleotide-binding protein [Rickettsiales bacterium]
MTYDTNNIFAKILRREIPSNTVYEDDYVLAFHDISPAAPVHVLVIPKREYVSFDDFAANAPADYMTYFWQSVRKVAEKLGVDKSGYRLITNHKEQAGQSVFHFHVHIVGGRALGGLLP